MLHTPEKFVKDTIINELAYWIRLSIKFGIMMIHNSDQSPHYKQYSVDLSHSTKTPLICQETP